VCWKPCSSCWSLHLLREEFLLAPIPSPPYLVRRIGPSKGSETCLLQVILLFAFVWLSIACWSFFFSFLFFFFSLLLLYMGAVNALIKWEIEYHVWFEDRWMVTSLCDE
jgi:hypothetical protein